MDFTLIYLRRNASITRRRRLKFTRAKTWRRSMPRKIAKLAAKYKRCEISANVRHCTRLELFKCCKFLEFRKFPDTVHSTERWWYSVVFDRAILEQGVCGIDPRAKFPRREEDRRKWNDDIDGRDSFYLRMRVATKKQRNTRGSPCRRRVGRSWQTGKLLVAMNRTNNRPPHLRCQQGKRGRH